MSKRNCDYIEDKVHMKKGRFAILADYDDGARSDTEEETSTTGLNSEEKLKRALEAGKHRKNRRPSNVHVNKSTLSMLDFSHLCHSFIAKNEVRRPTWLMFSNFKNPAQLCMLRLNCSEKQLNDEDKQLRLLPDLFKSTWTQVGKESLDRTTYWNNLMRITVSKRTQLKVFFKTQQKDHLKEFQSDSSVKLALLTTIEDMAVLNYPIHDLEQDNIVGLSPVVPSRKQYAKVTADSPIFALDCEMCVTDISKHELTRVTLIDEHGRVLIDTFVKPFNKIVDYLTCFSGVTEESLRNVSVRLSHVQDAFRRLLPADAILCGHSIENDLKALRMSHPYCIDVGFAYNMVNKKIRTSLRGLAYYYLNERIQSGGNGHCSYQDAWATLRLLKLKLEHGISFGSIALGFNYIEWAKKQKFYDCAQLFQISSARDFAKGSYSQVTLPKPRQIGMCSICSTSMHSQCYIESCPCLTNVPNYCCICVAKDNECAEIGTEDLFDFGRAISVLKNVCHQPTMEEVLNGYKKSGKVMIARYLDEPETLSKLTCRNIHIYDMTPIESITQLETQILDEKVLSHDLCLLEYNVESLSMPDLDRVLSSVYDRVARNGVLGCLFCSPNKAILYLNAKP